MQRHSGGVPEGSSEMRRGKRRDRPPEVRPTYVHGRIFLPVVEWRTLMGVPYRFARFEQASGLHSRVLAAILALLES